MARCPVVQSDIEARFRALLPSEVPRVRACIDDVWAQIEAGAPRDLEARTYASTRVESALLSVVRSAVLRLLDPPKTGETIGTYSYTAAVAATGNPDGGLLTPSEQKVIARALEQPAGAYSVPLARAEDTAYPYVPLAAP
jgi:hypothetical protein